MFVMVKLILHFHTVSTVLRYVYLLKFTVYLGYELIKYSNCNYCFFQFFLPDGVMAFKFLLIGDLCCKSLSFLITDFSCE